MRLTKLFMVVFISLLLVASINCKNKPVAKETQKTVAEGEETGQALAKNASYDAVRKGVRLMLSYGNADSSFVGTIENTTKEVIKSVRVEVHLSNGIELGPTKSVDLAPGEKKAVKLPAAGQTFDRWQAHAEAGSGEEESEHRGDHERGEEREHGHKNEHAEHQ